MKTKIYAWKLKDIIMVGLIGSLFAFICYGTGLGLVPLLQIPVALTGMPATYALDFIYGVFFMAPVIAAYIIRKPGVALVASMITAFVQFLMGMTHLVFVSAFLQGGFAELAFAAFKYNKWNWGTMMLAAAGATVASFGWTWWTLGYFMLEGMTVGIAAILFFTRLASAALFTATISLLLAEGLSKTGVLRNYPISEKLTVDLDE